MKEKFIELLRSTNRENIEELIKFIIAVDLPAPGIASTICTAIKTPSYP